MRVECGENSREEYALLSLMEFCLGYEPGIASWGDTGEAIWLGDTTSVELGYVPQDYYTEVEADR